MHYAIVKVQFSFFMSNNFVRLHTKFNFALPGKVMEHKIGKKLLFNKTAIVLNKNLLETTIVQKKNEWNNFLLICKKPKVFFHFSKQSKSFVNRFFFWTTLSITKNLDQKKLFVHKNDAHLYAYCVFNHSYKIILE